MGRGSVWLCSWRGEVGDWEGEREREREIEWLFFFSRKLDKKKPPLRFLKKPGVG